MDMTEEALACSKQAMAASPSYVEGYLNLGRELIRAGENVAAIQSLAKAIQLQPDYFAVYHQLGSPQHSLGDREAAKVVEALRRSTDLEPNARAWSSCVRSVG